MRGVRIAVVALLLAMALGSCATESAPGEQKLTVVATTTVLGDVVARVAGGDAVVEVLMPVGADPHDFQASAAQVAAMNRADLVVANGLGLEEGLQDALDAAAADGVNVLEVAPSLNPIPFGDASDAAGHGGEDPHVWFDPVRMATATRLIAGALEQIDPGPAWSERGDEYAAELEATDARVTDLLSVIPDGRRKLVTGHESLGYFAERYGFEVIGVVIPGGSTLGDPSSEELARLIETMRTEDVRVIFAETTRPTDLADAVAAELGADVRIVSLYTGSLGEPGSGADTLITMLTTDAERIAGALGG